MGLKPMTFALLAACAMTINKTTVIFYVCNVFSNPESLKNAVQLFRKAATKLDAVIRDSNLAQET